PAGIIESSNGRASDAPAPRRSVRLDRLFRVMNMGSPFSEGRELGTICDDRFLPHPKRHTPDYTKNGRREPLVRARTAADGLPSRHLARATVLPIQDTTTARQCATWGGPRGKRGAAWATRNAQGWTRTARGTGRQLESLHAAQSLHRRRARPL